MRLNPFGVFDLSSLRGLNWVEGLNRIKVFLMWLWVIPITLLLLYLLFSGWLFSNLFFLLLVLIVPLIGLELGYRAVIWIVAGFLKEGDSRAQFMKLSEEHPVKEVKKVIDWFGQVGRDLRKAKPRDHLLGIFWFVWLMIWGYFVTEAPLNPLSHWRQSGITFPLINLTSLLELKIIWFAVLTILKAIFCFILFIAPLGVADRVIDKVIRFSQPPGP